MVFVPSGPSHHPSCFFLLVPCTCNVLVRVLLLVVPWLQLERIEEDLASIKRVLDAADPHYVRRTLDDEFAGVRGHLPALC